MYEFLLKTYEIYCKNHTRICNEIIETEKRISQIDDIVINFSKYDYDFCLDETISLGSMCEYENYNLRTLKKLDLVYSISKRDVIVYIKYIVSNRILEFLKNQNNTLLDVLPKEVMLIVIRYSFGQNFETYNFTEFFLKSCYYCKIPIEFVFYHIKQDYMLMNIIDLLKTLLDFTKNDDIQLYNYSIKFIHHIMNYILHCNTNVEKYSIAKRDIMYYCLTYFNQKEILDFLFLYSSDYMLVYGNMANTLYNMINDVIANYTFTKNKIPIEYKYKNRISPDEGRLALNFSIIILNNINSVRYLFETYNNINSSCSDKFVVSIKVNTDKKILKLLKRKNIKTQISNKLY